MGINRQIGWGNKEILLYEIYKKIKRANSLAYKMTQGDFHPIPDVDNILLENGSNILLENGSLILLE